MRIDPLYTELREAPPSSDELDALVDEFMDAANAVFPGFCVHFDDWKGTDAIRLLARYKDNWLVYNADIQGTASVTIAVLITTLQNARAPPTRPAPVGRMARRELFVANSVSAYCREAVRSNPYIIR